MTTKTKQPDPDEAREQVHFAALLIGLLCGAEGSVRPVGVLAGYRHLMAAARDAPCGPSTGVRIGAVAWLTSYVQALGKGYEPSMEPATEADREALIILRHEVAEAHRLAGGGAIH